MLDIKQIKKNFPIFDNLPQLVYLDSSATSLKPKHVVNKLVEYYENYPANIHRGIYKISERATEEYEKSREQTAKFVNAYKSSEIVFTRNTTEAINLVAYSLGKNIIEKNDEIIISIMEHHSNFVPWQQLAIENKAILKIIDIDENFQFSISNFQSISKKTKILALTYVSNVLGTINPIKKIIALAKKINPQIITIVDAAQAAPHLKIDVQNLGCDFLTFSSHKMLGPTGIGVLWGRYDLFQEMFPFQFGGGMIDQVLMDRTSFLDTPYRFEAGTPAIGDAIAFSEAIKYLNEIGLNNIENHERQLAEFFTKRVKEEFGEKIIIHGPNDLEKRISVFSFSFGKYHPHDISQILDEANICVRAGHHCAMPLHKKLGIGTSARASFYLYNDKDDVEKLISGLKKVEKTL